MPRLDESERFLMVKFTLKNITKCSSSSDGTHFNRVADVDGVSAGSAGAFFQASQDKSFQSNLQAGQEIKLRYIYKVANDVDMIIRDRLLGRGEKIRFLYISGTK